MTDTTAFDKGSSEATPHAKECQDVAAWQKKLKKAREYDKPAREQYARDRGYARGDTASDMGSNIAGVFVNILTDFLYAKNPDVDILPAKSAQPPGITALRAAAKELVLSDPAAMAKIEQAAMSIGAQAAMTDPDDERVGQLVIEAQRDQIDRLAQAKLEDLQAQYAKRNENSKAFGETLEIVVGRMWMDAELKRNARAMCQTGLTVALGVLKASWQERTSPSPQTAKAIRDLQDNIARVEATRKELDDDEKSLEENQSQREQYKRELASLKGQAEQVIARGYVIDTVQPEDFQVAIGYTIANHTDAPWNAHRRFILVDDAKAEYGKTFDGLSDRDRDDLWAKATKFSARCPVIRDKEAPAVNTEITAEHADRFVKGSEALGTESAADADWIEVWEIWDANSGHVLTMATGMDRWLLKPWQPKATTRFYPFFVLPLHDLDGQRHPQSYISRSYRLLDEYDRLGVNFRNHRARCVPKLGFNKSQVSPEDAAALARGSTAEMVGLDLPPNMPIGDVLKEIAYPAINPALYDDNPIMAKLERIWGVQEALSGSIQNTKTATEAEIQQGGFQARTSSRRDLLEIMLTDLAQYTAEVAWSNMSEEDVVAIAGPNAVWPKYNRPEDLRQMLQIEIRAGSSGKPNTSAEREAWSVMLPILQNGIVQIGQLRQSSPQEVSDKLEQLLRLTGERMGDRLDFDQLIPAAGPANAPPLPGEAPPMGAPTAPIPTA